jgi:hypothetical protein
LASATLSSFELKTTARTSTVGGAVVGVARDKVALKASGTLLASTKGAGQLLGIGKLTLKVGGGPAAEGEAAVPVSTVVLDADGISIASGAAITLQGNTTIDVDKLTFNPEGGE